MQFQGERTLAVPIDIVYSRLTDATYLTSCIPDATPVGTPTADVAQCSVRPNLSFARGNLDVAIKVILRQPNAASKFMLTSKGIGSGADVEANLTFSSDGDQTKIAWTAAIVKLNGLLKMVPAGLIRGAAQKIIDDVWTRIDAKLSAGRGASC